jgi:hypothetical protein
MNKYYKMNMLGNAFLKLNDVILQYISIPCLNLPPSFVSSTNLMSDSSFGEVSTLR